MKIDPETLAVSKLSYLFEKQIQSFRLLFFVDNMPFNINLDIC